MPRAPARSRRRGRPARRCGEARCVEDPFVKDEVQPTLTVAAMVRGDERLEREFSLIKLPVLIMHSTTDKVTRPEGSQLFYDQAGRADTAPLQLSQRLGGTTVLRVVEGKGFRQERRFALSADASRMTLKIRVSGAALQAPVSAAYVYARR
jgi:hypothetical protein